MIEKIKDFGYNLVNDNQTKALAASVVINIILVISLLSILITGNVPGHSKDDTDSTDNSLITECTLEHVSSTTSTTTTEEESTTTSAGKTTVRNQGNNTTANNGTTTKKVTTTTTTKKVTTTTAANLDNDGGWVDGWYQ